MNNDESCINWDKEGKYCTVLDIRHGVKYNDCNGNPTCYCEVGEPT